VIKFAFEFFHRFQMLMASLFKSQKC